MDGCLFVAKVPKNNISMLLNAVRDGVNKALMIYDNTRDYTINV